MRLAALLFSLSVATPVAARQAPDTVRVDVHAAVAAAVARSPDILAQAARGRFAEARLGEARASRFLTQFTATSAHAASPGLKNPNGTPNDRLYLDPAVRNDWSDLHPYNRVDVDLVQPLWTWGQLSGSIRAARSGAEVEAEALRGQRLDVARRTGELYYGVVLAEALVRLTGEAADIVEMARSEIRRLLDEGAADVDDADLFQVQITEQELLRRVVEAEERGRTARAALRRQLMLPDQAVVVTEDRLLEPMPMPLDSLDAYFDAALASRPELARARAAEAARAALVEVARSDYFPKLFAGVSAELSGAAARHRQRNPYVGDPFLSRSLTAGLGLRMNLNVALTRQKVEQAQANLDEVRHLQEGARQLVLFEVEEAYRMALVRRAAVDAAEEALRISKDWLRTEQINFDLDLGDTENLVKAVQANLQLQAARHQAVYDLNVALLSLMRASGTIDRDIGSD